MLSFKQYLKSNHYRDHQAKAQQRTLPVVNSINETKNNEVGMIPKWDLIRMIAEDPAEIVQVDLRKEGVWFAFVVIEPKS